MKWIFVRRLASALSVLCAAVFSAPASAQVHQQESQVSYRHLDGSTADFKYFSRVDWESPTTFRLRVGFSSAGSPAEPDKVVCMVTAESPRAPAVQRQWRRISVAQAGAFQTFVTAADDGPVGTPGQAAPNFVLACIPVFLKPTQQVLAVNAVYEAGSLGLSSTDLTIRVCFLPFQQAARFVEFAGAPITGRNRAFWSSGAAGEVVPWCGPTLPASRAAVYLPGRLSFKHFPMWWGPTWWQDKYPSPPIFEDERYYYED